MVHPTRSGAEGNGGCRRPGLAAPGRRALRETGGRGRSDRVRLHKLHSAGRPARRSDRLSSAPILSCTAYLPAKRHPSVVLDIATTVVAMQMVRVAAGAG